MKKNLLILFLAILGMAATMTSCQKDDVILDPKPTINFKGGGNYTSSDVTINEGESFAVGITAAANVETSAKLKSFSIVFTSNNVPTTLIDEQIEKAQETNYSKDFQITLTGIGEGILKAKITDDKGEYAEVSFKVTVKQAGVEVKKKTNVEFGSYNDAIGSFYGTTNETVYTIAQAFQNQALVDIIFFKGATNANTLAAPDDADANSINDYNLVNWTKKNKTRFILTTMTAAEFDAIGTIYQFPEFVAANATTKVNNLAAGNVVYFKTEAGKHGYAKIVDLYTKGNKAKIDFIVEK
ncbi:hypothetical protein MASR2M12_12770 [Bacteroidales bacterium]